MPNTRIIHMTGKHLLAIGMITVAIVGCGKSDEHTHIAHWIYDEEATAEESGTAEMENAGWHGGTALTIHPDGKFSMALIEKPGEFDDVDIVTGVWVASRDYIILRAERQDMKGWLEDDEFRIEAPKAWGKQPIHIFRKDL